VANAVGGGSVAQEAVTSIDDSRAAASGDLDDSRAATAGELNDSGPSAARHLPAAGSTDPLRM
jgi:hypothetical protein